MTHTFTAFTGHTSLAHGTLEEVALVVARHTQGATLIFSDQTGAQTDVDVRGTDDEIVARLAAHPLASPSGAGRKRPGRPKLGVKSREVTLLPRHWAWLSAQPGSSSAVLRRLIDKEMNSDASRREHAVQVAGKVMWALAGDLPGFEDASRALFAGDDARFEAVISAWPVDVKAYLARLIAGSDRSDKR